MSNKGLLVGRTDLAFEEVIKTKNEENIARFEPYSHTKVYFLDQEEKYSNMKSGNYYTIITENNNESEYFDELTVVLRNVLSEIMVKNGLNAKSKCLVVGLGNYNITPDSLGPAVCDNIMATNHLNIESLRDVCVVAPGVMGQTGIESYEIISSIVEKVDPDFLIVIDALAANNINRVGKSIQITDVGINPGSGVGNNRKELSFESLGKKVIAIGCPLVLDVASIVSDSFDYILKSLNDFKNGHHSSLEVEGLRKTDFNNAELPNKDLIKEYLGNIGLLSEEDKKHLLKETLEPNKMNLIVTFKDIDLLLADLVCVFSEAINNVLNPS